VSTIQTAAPSVVDWQTRRIRQTESGTFVRSEATGTSGPTSFWEMLPAGAPALNRDEALELLRQLALLGKLRAQGKSDDLTHSASNRRAAVVRSLVRV